MSGNLHMGTGMGIVHVVINVHVCTMVCQGSLQWSSVHHPMEQFGNPHCPLPAGVHGC